MSVENCYSGWTVGSGPGVALPTFGNGKKELVLLPITFVVAGDRESSVPLALGDALMPPGDHSIQLSPRLPLVFILSLIC